MAEIAPNAGGSDSVSVPDKSVAWYIQDEDLPPLPDDVRAFLSTYGKLPQSEVQSHVLAVREKAWRVFPFPCIGQNRFLDFAMSAQPAYPRVLSRLTSPSLPPGRLIDVGCGLAADLRRLVADGVSPDRLVGLDQRPDFIDVGYDLFRDRDSFGARFVTGDVTSVSGHSTVNSEVASLRNSADFVFAASFLHLFGWAEQVKVCIAISQLLKKESEEGVIFGRFVGSPEPLEYPHPTNPSGVMYAHDEATFQKLWDEVAETAGEKWKAAATFTDNNVRSRKTDQLWKGSKFQVMHFEVTRR